MKFARIATLTKSWDKAILANPDGGNIFQSLEFAQQKEMGGWKAHFITADTLHLTILEKPIFGLGKLWYIPKGPGITTAKQLDDILPDLRKFSKKNGVFLVKIEPELTKQPETITDLMKLGLVKARPIQPNFSTVLLDTSPDLDTVLKNLPQKGRHAIRRAERDGVTIRLVESTDENCRTFYDLLAKTAEGSFRIRSFDYYKTFWQRFSKANLGQMFFAYVDDQVVSAAYAIAFGKKGTYKDGASVRERTVYGASHLLQWRIIQWMKEKGITVHDLCGAPPSDEINNPQHPHYGIGRFKTSFNKEVTDYVGAYDLVIRPAGYKIWSRFLERLTLRLHYALHHESYY
jgi:lipid II:glycine glycyltransferase (peptidoglycan interpeptide bridge formation enzyme)